MIVVCDRDSLDEVVKKLQVLQNSQQQEKPKEKQKKKKLPPPRVQAVDQVEKPSYYARHREVMLQKAKDRYKRKRIEAGFEVHPYSGAACKKPCVNLDVSTNVAECQ